MTKLRCLQLVGPVIGRLPRVFYLVAAAAAWIGWHTRPDRRDNLIRNLLPFCDGDRDRARREGMRAYRNVGRYWVDLIAAPRRDMSSFEREHMRIIDQGRLRVLGEPGPIIVISAHTGAPDLTAQALTHRGRPFVALVEAIQPPEFAEQVLRLRSGAGGQFYSAGYTGIRACIEALREGGLVAVLGDRDIQGTGICATLGGRRVKLPRGPWELARRTHALVIPMFTTRNWSDHITVYVEETFRVACSDHAEMDIRVALERWAALLEQHLRREPGQWAVLEDFWRVHACD